MGEREEADETQLRIATKKVFEMIGCAFTLNVKTIKSAYRKKALEIHPDKGGTKEEFQQLTNRLDKSVLAIAT